MDTLYNLSVKVGLDATGMTAGASMALRWLNTVRGAAMRAGMSADAFNSSLKKVAAGMAVFGAGMVGVGVLKSWTAAAADLQSAMAGVGLATQGSAAQLATLQGMTYGVANKTQFSAPQIADIEKLAAVNGLNSRAVLTANNGQVVQTLANIAEIDQRLRSIPYAQSVPAAVRVAHDFQSYPTNAAQAKSFTSLIDLFGRSQLVAGTTPDQMANLITKLAPARAALGLKPQDIIATAALASNVGLSNGAGGGATVAAIFRTIVPLLTSRGAIHNHALDAIQKRGGGSFFDAKGQFEGVSNMLRVVMMAMQHTSSQQQRLQLLNTAFQQAGGRAFSLLATPGTMARFASIQGLLGPTGIASTDTMQRTLNSTLQGQMATFRGNLTSINALLGQQLLPILGPIVHGFVEMSGALVTFLRLHPLITQFVAVFTLVATATALVVGPLMAFAGIIAIVTGAVGLGAIVAAVAPFVLIIGALVLAITGLILVITHWKQIMHTLGLPGAPTIAQNSFVPGVTTQPNGATTPTTAHDPKHGHYVNAGRAGQLWVPDPIKGKTGGGGANATVINNHVAAGAIVVHAQPHHNEQQIASNVFSGLAEALGHAVSTGSPSSGSLMPALRMP